MKRVFIVTLLAFFVISIFAEVRQNDGTKNALNTSPWMLKTRASDRALPVEVTIAYAPISLMFSYNDYFMGSYSSIPIRMQDNGAGIYMIYHGQETNQTASRKEYYNYIQNGQNANSGRITTDNVRQGYAGFDIDPVTNDPFVAWHGEMATGSKLDVSLAYDQYHLFNTPNMWSSYNVVINNGNGPDEFIWPYVHVGESPMGAEYRRVYTYSSNATNGAAAKPSENVKLAYTDITTEMLDGTTAFDWTITTIPQMDDWHNDTVFHRPFYSFFCDGPRIGFMGYLVMDSTLVDEPDLFVLYNDNYGMGNFTLEIVNSERFVENPMNYFNSIPLFFSPCNSNYFNVSFDSIGRLHMISSWGLQNPGGYYWNFQYVKDVQYDFTTNEFKVLDIEPKGADDANYYSYEDDGLIYLPWDENADGIIDEIGNNAGTEYPIIRTDFPFYWWDYNDTFNETNFKIVRTPGDDIMVAVWQNSDKARQFHEFNDTEYTDWANVPEVVVEISGNNGDNWSKPLYFNSIDTPEVFGGMIPEYIYPCDVVEKRIENGDTIIRVHFMFYNDLSYGSFVYTNGDNIGGNLMYMALDFNLSLLFNPANDPVAVAAPKMLKQNYPNPFNPSTRIEFNNPKTQHVNIGIYNSRGQLVKTLANEVIPAGTQYKVWDGLNNSNETVTSGVYFYKMTAGNQTEMKKMVLIK